MLAPLYPPAYRGGGPIRSIEAMVKTAPVGTTPIIITADRDLNDPEPLNVARNVWSRRDDVDVYYASVHSPRRLWRAMRELRRARPTILHLNGFLNPFLTLPTLACWRLGFLEHPLLLLAPRGEFGSGALSRHRLRKRLYITLFRTLRIHRAIIWHSTAPHETEDIRGIWGEEAIIVERENDALLPPGAIEPSEHDGPIRAVFLGRIVEHKGLRVLVSALKGLSVPFRLDVFGSPEDSAYLTECCRLAELLPPNVQVRFLGPLAPEKVTTVLHHYDALLLPTAGENFGHVIVEALSASCAVVTTPYTPWTDRLRGSGGGVIVGDRSSRSWAVVLESLARELPKDRHYRRVLAGEAYSAWAARAPTPHVWTLVLEAARVRQ